MLIVKMTIGRNQMMYVLWSLELSSPQKEEPVGSVWMALGLQILNNYQMALCSKLQFY